ncbi:MAG: S41 family peptidase, partial [Candidatus Saccharimonadales bacterium]
MTEKGKFVLPKTVLILIIGASLYVGFILGTRSDQLFASIGPVLGIEVDTANIDLSSVEATYKQLQANYDGDLDLQKLVYGANRGMVEATGDPYTVYMDPEEAEKFNKDLEGDIGAGIGAEIGVRSSRAAVIRVLPNHPAEKAGVHGGDIIESVNGESAAKWDSDTTAKAIRGEKGTTVKLTVIRNGELKEFTITRDIINNPSVESRVEDGIGIIKISRFDTE